MSGYNTSPDLGDELLDLRRRLEAIEGIGYSESDRSAETVTRVTNIENPGAWQSASLVNGFANMGSGYAPAGYYIDALGRVYLRGVVTQPASGGLPLTIFTLASGFRPAYRHDYAVSQAFSGAIATYVVSAHSDGRVTLSENGPYSGALLPLDVVQFRTS